MASSSPPTPERSSDAIIEHLLTSLQDARAQAETKLSDADAAATQSGGDTKTVATIQFDLLEQLLLRVDALEKRNRELEDTIHSFASFMSEQHAQRAVSNQRMGHLRRVFEKKTGLATGTIGATKGNAITTTTTTTATSSSKATPTNTTTAANSQKASSIHVRAASLQGALGLNAGFKSGWLYKEGRVRKAPKRRWFVLRGDKLLYFGGPNSPTDKPKGSISLESCAVESTLHDLKVSNTYTAKTCLVLLTHDRKLYFVGETEEETQEWKIAIATSIVCCSYVRKARIVGQETDKRVMDFFNTPTASSLFIVDQPCRGNPMDAIAALSQAFPLQRYLTTIRLRNIKMGDLEIGVIADGLIHNTSIKLLDVSRNNIGPDGARDIARIISSEHNKTLEEINIQYNHIGCTGLESIAKALASQRALQRLFLQYNGIKDQGAIALANALCSKSQYEGWHCMPSLELSHNEIGCEGAAALSAIIAVNPNVQTVRLTHNDIGDSGCESLASALAGNKNVEEVELVCNPKIGVKGSRALVQVLNNNTSLTAMDVASDLSLESSGLAAVRVLWRTEHLQPSK